MKKCYHRGQMAARWNYITPDESYAMGWVVCADCKATLERLVFVNGRPRPSGFYTEAFREQLAERADTYRLADLEID